MMSKVPSFFKTAQCNVCGSACVPMAHGDRFFDIYRGRRVDVVVCFDCDRQLGDMAYIKASQKIEEE